jgi:hypothetical protein
MGRGCNAVCAAIATGLLALAPGAARATPLAYAATGDDLFGVVDLGTGAFAPNGNMGLRLTGLGVGPGGALYGGGYHSGTLYEVDPLNGELATVGTSAGFVYFATGSTTGGIYALDNDADMNLYSVNPKTGAVSLIGPTGLSPFEIVIGLSTGSSALYLTEDSSLYSVDTATGAATLVGASAAGLFGPSAFEDGALYSGAFPSAIWSLSTADGQGTFIADVTGPGTNFWGLAPDVPRAVPEPSSLWLFVAGLVGLLRRPAGAGPQRFAALR